MPSLLANKRVAQPKGVAVAPPSIDHHSLPCPRCDSINTKFCYFNNYNFSQPRYFCKSCRRYWTHGGALRDIPIGGASRKTAKRGRSSAGKPPIQEPINGNPLVSITYPINANGFASFMTSPGPGILGFGGYGLGLGLDDDGFGLGLGVWAFPEGGNGDCFPPFP